MKSRKRAYSIALCCLLAVTVLLPGLVFLFAGATAADDQEESLLGTLSAQFEASSPGMVSSGTGDLGGKSYGAYQFASRYDTPKAFFEWCLQQDDTYYRSVGERLQDAYYSGGAGYGTNFDNTWRALNNEDSAGFLRVQRNYVRLSYYEPIVAKLEANVPGFSADDYSIALRNVLWSRAAQHGTGGAYSVVTRAFAALGGFKNQPEAELIDAIYAESGRLTTDAATTMSGATAERYGVSGKALAYYTGCSGEVQLGVYLRLRVNEPAKAQAMLAQYGYADAVIDEGVYRIQPSSNTNLSAVAGSTSVSLNGVADSDAQRFQLTYYASGYYAITCRDSGLRLTAASDGSVTMEKPANTDRSKNAAYIPPAFGSPTSYTLNAGELLTPNFVSGSAMGTVSGTGGVTVLPPAVSGSANGSTGSYTPVKYTTVTKDLYYSGGYLGTLKIPTLGLSVKVYQGTDADALRKGAGHFASTSIWEGNVAIAGHNRGVNNHFGKIHILDIGDTIKLTTQLGTRSYEVYSVSKIGVDDTSVLSDSTENIITLVTCVMNQPDYRWCVQAREK